jgi:hypothetical protein
MSEGISPLRVSVFVAPKNGSSSAECEDTVGIMRDRMRFCVADGATEAFDSRHWARLLTKSWSLSPRAVMSQPQFEDWLPAVGDRFHARWDGKKLPWYSEEKSRAGAFAAFAGLVFESDGESDGESGGRSLRWTAAVLGDSCLFRVTRNGVLSSTIPDVSGVGFHFRPTLLPSKRSLQPDALSRMLFGTGEVVEGDVFFLLTDAIAIWYARMLQDDQTLARRFDAMMGDACQTEVGDLIGRERARGTLHNDDIAVIRIECAGKAGGRSTPPGKY